MDFVTFEIAKKLKEKEYPQVKKNTLAMYNENGEWYSLARNLDDWEYLFEDFDDKDCVCPTISQALKWFREEKHLHIELVAAAYGYNYIVSQTPEDGGTDYYSSACDYAGPNDGGAWDSYEQAALAGIECALNLI